MHGMMLELFREQLKELYDAEAAKKARDEHYNPDILNMRIDVIGQNIDAAKLYQAFTQGTLTVADVRAFEHKYKEQLGDSTDLSYVSFTAFLNNKLGVAMLGQTQR